MERKRRCFAYAESDEKALSVMRPVFGRDGLVPSVIAKVLQLPLGNKRKV